jgi:hypothetical protein
MYGRRGILYLGWDRLEHALGKSMYTWRDVQQEEDSFSGIS